ncbi:MAG: hypothetical protein GY873_39185 [Bosea sp.]|uniref:hypothetical protein n=1 Tax=Bosea sp. (in: a-proteobacteria) TaxID=1871050 RepID=UPI0023851183|nr:hypothetical protein [Bosea sp. (in: a-proteobacteria)]MCP4740229.1 hypothetical protein [Bosea sp. (in: a-proteobacteria)]
MSTIEAMEQRLDLMVSEALRREAHRLDLAGASKEQRASAMASARSKIVAWRSSATAGALRSAVAGRPS